MSKDINELRSHLFDTLAALRDKENPMDIERAKVMADVAQVIINSAKVEVDHARVTKQNIVSGFLGDFSAKPVEHEEEEAKELPALSDGEYAELRDAEIGRLLPKGTTSPKPGVLVHRSK